MFYKFIGMWVLRRAYRLATADDGRPLQARVRGEARRVFVGAAITLALLALGVVVLIVLLIVLVTS